MDVLVEYILRIAPGIVLGIALLMLIPRDQTAPRILIHILLFILIRDAMTPAGLWTIGGAPAFWLRLPREPVQLLGLTTGSIGLVAVIVRLEPALLPQLRGQFVLQPLAIAAGIGCALLIAAPVLVLAHGTPVAARGGAVAPSQLPLLLVMSLAGNAYEELLFRGYWQGWLEDVVGSGRAVLVSGLTFAFGHVFLAATVSDLGSVVLAFTAYEGLLCAELRRRHGLAAAILAHGGGIFLIASGLG